MTVKIELGTLIHGTLRTQDLLQAFADELDRLRDRTDPTNSDADAVTDAYELLNGGVTDSDDAATTMQEALYAVEARLELYAPDGCYFGSIEGDGADFGFWTDEDSLVDYSLWDEDIATGKCNQRDSISCIKQTINGVYCHEQGCPNS